MAMAESWKNVKSFQTRDLYKEGKLVLTYAVYL